MYQTFPLDGCVHQVSKPSAWIGDNDDRKGDIYINNWIYKSDKTNKISRIQLSFAQINNDNDRKGDVDIEVRYNEQQTSDLATVCLDR